MTEALSVIDEFVREGRRTGRVHQVATVNVDFIVNALDRPDLLTILQRADLNLADGMPIVWASGLLGAQLPERVAGSDLVPSLAAESAERGWRIHLFGGARGVADEARQILLQRHPEAAITADAGPELIDPAEVDESVFERIAAHDPDILCVALGNPKQERFISLHRDRLQCSVAVGIGGSLDMLTGRARRAPDWAQQASAEWIFRAAQEPSRLLPRYARDARVFLPRLASCVRVGRRFEHCVPLNLHCEDATLVVRQQSGPTVTPVRNLERVRLELSQVSGVRVTDHAMLVALVRFAHSHGLPIDAEPWSHELLRQFRLLGTHSMLAPLDTQSRSARTS